MSTVPPTALVEAGGICLVTKTSKELHYVIRLAFKTTNNDVEYKAILAGLVVAERLGEGEVDVHVDS